MRKMDSEIVLNIFDKLRKELHKIVVQRVIVLLECFNSIPRFVGQTCPFA